MFAIRMFAIRPSWCFWFGAVCLLGLGWVNAQFALHGQLGDWGGDNAAYLIMADHLRHPNAVTTYMLERVLYPWGFPALLAVFGGGLDNIAAAHQVVLYCLMAAFAVAWFWWRQTIGDGPALLLILLTGLLPGCLLINSEILSENAYMLCALLACAAAERGRTQPQVWALLATVAAISCRSAGIALLPALLWAMLPKLRQPTPTVRLTVAAICGIGVGWWLLSRGVAGYGDAWQRVAAEQGAGDYLGRQGWALWQGWLELWQPWGGGHWIGGITLGFAALGCWLRCRQWQVDAAYVVSYGLLLLAWPFPAEAARLIYVVMPLLLWQAWHGADWCGRAAQRNWPAGSRLGALGYLWLVCCAMAIAPATLRLIGHSQWDFPPAIQPYRGMTAVLKAPDQVQAVRIAEEKAFAAAALQRLRSRLPAASCVQSIKPTIVTAYSGLRSRVPVLPQATPGEFAASLRACPYLLLLSFNSPSYPQMYPAERLGSLPGVTVVEKFETMRPDGQVWFLGVLVRVD